jgi:hypothetical protein
MYEITKMGNKTIDNLKKDLEERKISMLFSTLALSTIPNHYNFLKIIDNYKLDGKTKEKLSYESLYFHIRKVISSKVILEEVKGVTKDSSSLITKKLREELERFSLYAFLAGKKTGIKVLWKNMLTPSLTALGTCSSAAAIPTNLEATEKMGVTKDIRDTVIPLGAALHKDGSVMGGVLKMVFILAIFDKDIWNIGTILAIYFTALAVGIAMGAIVGGGMIGEMLILSMFGLPPEALPIIAVISTLIDPPATLLNATGDNVASMLVNRLVEGKDWLKKKVNIN